jgi:hypothetical protein
VCVGSCFHVLRSRTYFLRYQGRRVPFSCFARPDSFSTILRASGPVFMFCAPKHVFGDVEGVASCFHVLRFRTSFRRYRGRRLLFSCFALPDTFSAVRRALGPIFMFFALGLVFGGSEGVESRYHVLRSRTRFRWYRGRRLPFSCFTLLDSFSTVTKASTPVFMFCALGLLFGGSEGVRSRFHVLRSQTCFGGAEGVVSHFHVLRSRTRFRWYRGRRVPFSCFALPDSFFSGKEGVGSLCDVLSFRSHFPLYRGRHDPFSCFALLDSFSAVPRASAPVFMFCAPGLIFGDTEGVGSRF